MTAVQWLSIEFVSFLPKFPSEVMMGIRAILLLLQLMGTPFPTKSLRTSENNSTYT